MAFQLLNGRELSLTVLTEIAAGVRQLIAAGCRAPHLVAVLVGNDLASETYVAGKMRACEQCGFRSTTLRFGNDVTQTELLAAIAALNADDEVDGFIVQLPLPPHIAEQAVIEAIDPRKDVDGFHPMNVGRLSIGLPCFVGATPLGLITLLDRYGIDTTGKHCVVVGRSNIVGKPAAMLLMQKSNPGNCTVTVCHSATPDLARYTRMADILITAVGQPGLITSSMVSEGVVVLDVGITRQPCATARSGYRLVGDVDFDDVAPHCAAITPVPGGVGPMTIASLMRNTYLAATANPLDQS